MNSRIHLTFNNRWYLAQFFLVVAGAFTWNILGLAILIKRHKYLRTPDWQGILLIACLIALAAILGWIWAIVTHRKFKKAYDHPKQLRVKIAFWSGGVVFLLGWLICIGIMLRLMNTEPWCLTGALGAMLGDWLPNGLMITALTIIVSSLSNQWLFPSDS